MDELTAKTLVIKAGHALVEKGLIARTWGNVSCRIDGETFVVTPSGKAYESLTPDDIVLCKVADASYTGEIKPSSERGVHALVYREHPEAGFVIHTHQVLASAVSVLSGAGIPGAFSPDAEPVPFAGYGLPSTKKLCAEVGTAFGKTKGKAVIMAHHGTVCFGADAEAAFETVRRLEEVSAAYIAALFERVSGRKYTAERDLFAWYCEKAGAALPETPGKPGSSRRVENGFVLALDGRETTYSLEQGSYPAAAAIHAAIYKRRADIGVIQHADSAVLAAAAAAGETLLPMLDDFAQIAGRRVACAKDAAPESVVRALGKRAGVLVPGLGALCCERNASEAHAVRLVMEKNACAQITASLEGEPKPLGLVDCLVMRLIYKLSYSKKE